MAASSLDEKTVKEVLRQVEFYFSDSNIPRDNFLRKTIDSSEDGMVSLPLICSFKKMRGYLNLTDVTAEDIPEATIQAVAETLRKSTTVKVSEDGKKVGRIAEMLQPEDAVEQLDARTIAASPLEHNTTREAVESFFTQYAKVTSVRLPRHVGDKKVFSGTALIEFSTDEDAEKLLKESLTFNGAQLELKPKKEFDAQRAAEEEEFGNSHFKGSNNTKDSKSEASYPKGLIVAFTLKSTVAGVSKEQNGAQVQDDANASMAGVEENVSENANTDGLEEKNNTEEKADKVEAENGSESEVKNSGGEKSSESEGMKPETEEKSSESEGMKPETEEKSSESEGMKPETEEKSSEDIGEKKDKSCVATYKDNMNVVIREDLKAVFETFGTVKYIDFKLGEESGYVRFEEAEAAQKARAAAVLAKSGGLVVKSFIATLEPVSGDAEKDYWSQIGNSQGRFQNKGNRGRGGRNFRGGKHSRSRDNSGGGRPNKFQKAGA